MTRTQSALTLPLVILAGVLLAIAGAVKFTRDKVDVAQNRLSMQQAQLREAQTRVQKSGTEKELIIRYLPGYRQLAAIGFVGDEQRINWLDALRVVNQKGELFGVDYDISSTRPYPLAPSPAQMRIMQSIMKLRFNLLHEEDLPRFFDLLSNQKAGLFLVDQCTLRRARATQDARFLPNLSADCQLSWITAQPAAAPGNPP